MIKIDCISDLHGHYPTLKGGDLLIVAGDLTSNDQPPAWANFFEYIIDASGKYKEIIVIAGNHDEALENGLSISNFCPNVGYLCDSGTSVAHYTPIPKDAPEGFVMEDRKSVV